MKTNQSDLVDSVARIVQDVLINKQNWQAGFGTTFRQNGQVIKGSYRDTIDTGNTVGSIDVDMQGSDISIKFSNQDAGFIFDDRSEIGELVMDELMERISAKVAIYLIQEALG